MFRPSGESDHSKSLRKFIEFLKQSEKEKENRIEDDLGFEINFGTFQPEPKVSFFRQYLNRDFFTQFSILAANLISDASDKTFVRKKLSRSSERNRKAREKSSKRVYQKD